MRIHVRTTDPDTGCDFSVFKDSTVQVDSTPPPPPPPTDAPQSLLSDVGQNLVVQLVGVVGDRLGSGAAAAERPSSFVALGGRKLELDRPQDVLDVPDMPVEDRQVEWGERETLRELLARSPVSFGLSGGADGQPGAYALWGRAGVQKFEGRTQNNAAAYSGDLFSGTLGLDYQVSQRAMIGLGVTHSDGDGTAGANNADISLFTVHPYISWSLSDTTRIWGQLGYGRGDLTQTDSAGASVSDEDFSLRFAAVGSRSELTFDNNSAVGWAIKTDAQTVQVTGKRDRTLDSDTWRARTALEASLVRPLPEGGVLLPSLELGVRYDGGDTQEGLGLDVGGTLRLEDAAQGLTLEGSGRYLLTHHESSKRQWNVGALASFDAGAQGLGLALTMETSYGADALRSVEDIWDQQRSKQEQRKLRLLTTASYGAGVRGGTAVMTPYGRLGLGEESSTLREGLKIKIPGEKLRLEVYAEQEARSGSATDHSINVQLSLGF